MRGESPAPEIGKSRNRENGRALNFGIIFRPPGRPQPRHLLRLQQHHYQRGRYPGLRAPPVLHPREPHPQLDVRGADPGQEPVRVELRFGQVPIFHSRLR